MTPFRLAAAFFAAALVAAPAQTISDAFDTASDLSGFNQINSSGTVKTTSTGLQQAAGVGVGGSGGVQFVATTGQTDLSAIDATTAFSFGGGSGYTVGADFHKQANAATGALIFQTGFTSSSSVLVGASADLLAVQVVQLGTNTAQFQIGSRLVGASGTTYAPVGTSFAFNASSTDWYHLTLSLSLTDPATSLFSYTITLYDTGSDGTGSLTTPLETLTGTYTNTGIAADASVYAGFRFATATASAVDNFTVSPVPEPRTNVLLLGGLATVAAAALGAGRFRRECPPTSSRC